MAGIAEVIAGATTVMITLEPGADREAVEAATRTAAAGRRAEAAAKEVVVEACYDGPDLDEVATQTGLTPAEVVRRHAAGRYTVAFLGFSPGFAYLTGGDPMLRVKRRDSPRSTVPAGSVALADEMTAVYPQATPGGWQLIGRTGAAMFDPDRAEPCLVAPGDTVRFVPVDQVREAAAPHSHGRGRARAPSGRASSVEVVEPGPRLTIQDRGRTGWSHLGVPRAGAADSASAQRALALVGGSADDALFEATLSGPRLRLGADRLVAFTGAEAEITVDGLPARREVALHLKAGSELVVGPFRAGVRGYIAISGGLDVDLVLGSRSADTLSGLGPPPLAAGDRVTLGALDSGSRPGSALDRGPSTGLASASASDPRRAAPRAGDLIVVDAVLGPRDDWLSAAGLSALGDGEFEVEPTSDRTGVRLRGPTVDRSNRAELPSEGMVVGGVQVPPNGRPIVLMRNHPSTGGYPVAAVVDEAGIDRLAQAGPGVRVRFRLEPLDLR